MSSNGTRVGAKDGPELRGTHLLQSGDSIWVGDVLIEVTLDVTVETRKRARADYLVLDRPTADDLFAHQAGQRPRIRFIAGPHRHRLVLLGDRPIVLGRSEECEVVLHDSLLQLRHAILTKSEGQHYLVPVEGTGQPMSLAVNASPARGRTRLAHGDVVSIGLSVFELLTAEVSEHADPFETVALRQPRFVVFGEVRLTTVLKIGRDPTSDLFLDDPAVARHHAELFFAGRRFFVRSVGGAPIHIDGRAVVEAEVSSEQYVGVGDYLLRLDLEGFNCVIDVSRMTPDDQIPHFANDVESASPYQTIYRLPASMPKPEKRVAPKWREPWDVKKSLRLPLVLGISLLGVALIAGFGMSGGGERILGQPLSEPHEKLEVASADTCAACHGAFSGVEKERCAACHESNTPRPKHELGECTACHVEHRAEDRLALVSSARCAACHEDRHRSFARIERTAGSLAVSESSLPVPAIKADLGFDEETRSRRLHRAHGSAPKGCAACHELAAGGELDDPRRACFDCHQRDALATAPCAACHREHGDEWAPPAALDDLRHASLRAFGQAALGVFGLLFLSMFGMAGHSLISRRGTRAEKETRKEAETKALGEKFDVRINYAKCVPIGACVSACPFDVLEMAPHEGRGGKLLPKAVRLDQCKACRACEEACSVKAIAVVPMGSQAAALNLPELDANYESNIPGLYVVGEAAGKPLVKNANNLGLHVINHMIAAGLKPNAAKESGLSAEVVVLGAGPAGLSAAIAAKRNGLKVLLLERDESYATTHRRDYSKGKEVIAEPVDVENLGHLPVFTAPKEELLSAWGDAIRDARLEIQYHSRVESIERGEVGFTVTTDAAQYSAMRVVIATGARGSPRRLAVPGAELPHVRYAMEDPADFADAACVIVGGGDNAMEIALMLSDVQTRRKGRVSLVYRGASMKRGRPETREELEKRVRAGEIALHLEANPIEIREGAVVIERKGGPKYQIPADVVFCMLGAEPALEFLSRIGVKIVQKPADWDPGPTDVLVRRLMEEMKDGG
jgi:thioredoxin reductase/pSer/pThr/pTyr-binding forkhead associated (FHA) protein/NAD-dependent dihydropyrimidine dehydrogenase PreA subunit